MSLYVVILHYGKVEDTLACLKSIKDQKITDKIKVIVIDNSQKSDLKDEIKKYLIAGISIDYIPTQKNLGFAKGVNLGIRKALHDDEMDNVLILNNDTVIEGMNFFQLISNNADVCGPVIKFKHQGNWRYDYGGRINWWTGRTRHIESSIFNPPAGGQKSKKDEEIDYVSGCCMLVKRKVFEMIGLFDEDYFFYFEDVDFCVRAKQKGFKIAVVEDTLICHKLGASIGRWSGKAILYNLWGNFLFISKRMGVRKVSGYLYLLLLSLKVGLNWIRENK